MAQMATLGLRPVTAVVRLVAVSAALAGVFAMHTLATGHHGDLMSAGAPAAVNEVGDTLRVQSPPRGDLQQIRHADLPRAHTGVLDHGQPGAPCNLSCVPAEHGGAPGPPGHLLDVCMAILFAASAMFLRRRTGHRGWARLAAVAQEIRMAAPGLPRPPAPCLFALGVLRT